MISWLLRWWHKRQRDIDVQILWPACLKQASTVDRAREAFALHAVHDRAWLELGPDGIADAVRALKDKP
jgi:hypothetical protein